MAVKEEERQGVLKVDNFKLENKILKAANTRQATKQWKAEKQRAEEEYLAEAAAKRAAALAGREAARRKAEELKQSNTHHARMERENDFLVHEEKARILARNRVMRMERYKQRFATQDEADEFEASQLNHLYKFVK